jgi:hypothetical protein
MSMTWGDRGSPLFSNRAANLAIIIILLLMGCYAVYKAGEE